MGVCIAFLTDRHDCINYFVGVQDVGVMQT